MKYMSTLNVKLVATKKYGGTEVYFHEFLTSALGGGAFSGLFFFQLFWVGWDSVHLVRRPLKLKNLRSGGWNPGPLDIAAN
jgi:hypothetical protein